MKKLFTVLALFFSFAVGAQTLCSQYMQKYDSTWTTEQYRLSLKASTVRSSIPAVGVPSFMIVAAPAVSLSFSEFEVSKNSIVPAGTLAPTLGYDIIFGTGTRNANNTCTVDQDFSIGIAASGGVSLNGGKASIGTAVVGGTLGFKQYGKLFAGYDIANKTPAFGVALSISTFTFTQGDKFTYILKY